MNAININNLNMSYRKGKYALNSLCLTVPTGRIFGLIGPNGAGKTTLINILAGLIRWTSGEFYVFDRKIGRTDYQHRRQIGFVLSTPIYFENLTIHEYLEFVGAMYNVPLIECGRKILELVDFMDLNEKEHELIATLSRGMKQKISLAASIIHEPDLLVLDEPFDGLDATSAYDISSLLVQMKHSGATIMITSHNLELIESLCDEYAIIDNGSLTFQSRIDEPKTKINEEETRGKPNLRQIFLEKTSSDRRHKSLSWLE